MQANGNVVNSAGQIVLRGLSATGGSASGAVGGLNNRSTIGSVGGGSIINGAGDPLGGITSGGSALSGASVRSDGSVVNSNGTVIGQVNANGEVIANGVVIGRVRPAGN